MGHDLEMLRQELAAARSALQAEREKLRRLASNPFSVVGEARVTDDGISLTVLGDALPEPKLGLAADSFPVTVDAAMAMMHPDDRQLYEHAVTRSLGSGEPFDMNYRLADGRGGWRWLEGRALSVDVRDGRHVGWLFVVRDFTAQREAEETLLRSLRDLEASRSELKSEQDKLWRMAANSFSVLSDVRFTESGSTMSFFGDVPPEEKIGLVPGTVPHSLEGLMTLIHPDDIDVYRQQVEHCLATGERFKTVYRLADGAGGWRWLEASAFSVAGRSGPHHHWLCDTRDITGLKETEAKLRRSLAELEQLKTELQTENVYLREEIDRGSLHTEIIGRSAPLARVLEQVELVGATPATVLVTGETGTGKELVARAIHQRSARKQHLFVAMNCAALPATLVESELFGHEKGAFTGAIARRAGRFEQADGGTLFLDEVGELPLEMQAKMLRVLQSGEFERVGGEQTLKVDVRIIAASNRNLEEAVHQGTFRSDLYHRLAIFPIHLPPLRERREDLPLLTAYLVTRKARQLGRKIDSIASEGLARLTAYDWPGNVRELENVLERAIILSPGPVIGPAALQLGSGAPVRERRRQPRHDVAAAGGAFASLEEREREHILQVCRSTGWKIKGTDGAAAILDINPGTLYARMKKLGIRRPTGS